MINIKKNLQGYKKYPVICTFYTNNWLYEKYAMELKSSCEKLNLCYFISEKKNTTNYLHNCKYKPSFIFESLQTLERPILWIDADGMLLQKPKFFKNLDYDFAAKKMSSNRRKSRRRQWHVGTMFFNYNNKVLNFVKEWETFTSGNAISDEHGLDLLWKTGYFDENNLSYTDIPKEYFHIDKPKYGPITQSTVISHRISSDPQKIETMKKRKAKK
jgi:hypothetical protein